MLKTIFGLLLCILTTEAMGQTPFTLPTNVIIAEAPKGTGNATGIIATMKLQNKSKETIYFDTAPFYIPSDGKYQAYIIPKSYRILLPPGKKIAVSFSGYCLDLHRPAAPKNKKLPAHESWLSIDNSTSDRIAKYIVDPKYLTIPRVIANLPEFPDEEKSTALLPRERLEEGLIMILDAYQKLDETIETLQISRQLSTVFSSLPEKERQTLLQHSLWIYVSALTGNSYEYEYFERKLIYEMENEMSTSVGKMPESLRQEIMNGSKGLWQSFLNVSTSAGVIKSSRE